MTLSTFRLIPFSLVLAFIAGAGAFAQDPPVWDGSQTPTGDLMFEHVGDYPINAQGTVFDSTGTLIVGGHSDVLHLNMAANTWLVVDENFQPNHLLALHPDTLIADRGALYRTLDGGETWTEIHDAGGGLYQTPSGLLLTGMPTRDPGIAYSTDRGDTWLLPSFPDHNGFGGFAFLVLPDGHPHAGRFLAAGIRGLAYSDDDGQSWQTSNIFQPFRYIGDSFALTASGRVLSTTADATVPGEQLYGSDDGGETWTLLGSFVDPPKGFIGVPRLLSNSYSYALPDESVWVISGRGRVWRSMDSGDTWTLEGVVPDMLDIESVQNSTIVGPDGRIYAGVVRAGPAHGWMWRTVDSVLVGNESDPEFAEERNNLRVFPNPSTGTLTIEADMREQEAVVYDLRGREVMRMALPTGRTEIATSSLPAGVYVVEVGGVTQRVTIAR